MLCLCVHVLGFAELLPEKIEKYKIEGKNKERKKKLRTPTVGFSLDSGPDLVLHFSVFSYTSARKLLKLDSIQFILENHTVNKVF